MLCLSFVFHLKSAAQEPANLLTARITAVKETDWQREMALPMNFTGLRERLKARTLVELSGEMTGDEVQFLSVGKERGFVTEWGRTADQQEVEARKTEKQLIGTEIRVERLRSEEGSQETRLLIKLTHDLQPPQMESMTYATAAVGAERDKHSISVPCFERLRWQGAVVASQEERMLASFPSPQDAETRIVLFFQGSEAGGKAKADVTVQHTLYRVPELEMIEWLLQTQRDDAAVAHHLKEAVAVGEGSILSSAILGMTTGIITEAQIGSEHRVPTEMDQYFDQLYLVPTTFQQVLQGTRLSLQVDGNSAAFNSTYAPHPPVVVKWPTSWLRARDERGTNSKAIHGWMDWHDRVEEEIKGNLLICGAGPQVAAMMPPADQVWGTERKGRWLDVTVVQQPGWKARPAEADQAPPAPALPLRRMFIGLALDNDAAHALLAARQPGQDDGPLLRELLARTREGKARVMACALSAHENSRHTLSSARLHAYPTEMPSIPSAWESMLVGTQLEEDGEVLAFTQHLAPPARTEWKLARDVPEAVMWEPRFRSMSLCASISALLTSGTHLLTAANVPEVMAAADMPEHETCLFFSHIDAGSAATEAIEDAKRDYEIEALIFETSAKEASAWQKVEGAQFENFLRQQLKNGSAKLLSHTLQRANSSTFCKLSLTENYLTATEFDPPAPEAPLRMRPTALQDLPVGLQFEGDLLEGTEGQMSLKVKLQHSTARPVEPSLGETLRISANTHASYPGAKHERDEWEENIHITSSEFHRLLPPTSTSSDKATTRSAWVRLRRAQ